MLFALIQGQGLFATQGIEAGEMVIEYAGEVIRKVCGTLCFILKFFLPLF